MNKERTIVCAILLALAFAILIVNVSCNIFPTEEELVEVSLKRMADKALSVKSNDTTVTYEYKATPNSEGNTVGETDWREIELVEDEASLGLFSQGVWTFELRGKNSDGTVLSYGITVTKLSSLESNQVAIALGYIAGTGSLDISVSLDVSAYEGGSMELWYKTYSKGSFGEKVSTTLAYDEESKTYSKVISDLLSGNYLVGVVYSSGEDDNSGQILGVRIMDGVTTTIRGTVENGVFYGEDMTVTSLRTLKGTIGEEPMELETDATATLTWVNKGTVPATSYAWYVGDTLEEGVTTSSYIFTQSDIQSHVVTCVAYGEGGEIASASVLIHHAKTWIFREADAKLEGFSFGFDGERLSIYRNGKLYTSILEGDTQGITDLRTYISFVKDGNKVTVLRDENTPIGYFDYQ